MPSRIPFMFASLPRLILLSLVASAAFGQREEKAPELDFLYFKEKVQPVFLAERPGHARCVACHAHRSPQLQPLSPGAKTWDAVQSRKNFDVWKLFVTPGKPMESKMLLHPLAEDAGGDAFHAGGKHWSSQASAEWQTLAAWVRGQRFGGLSVATASGGLRIIQSNSAGDDLDIIDPQSDEIVGIITGIEAPHGVAIAPDGKRIYVSNESRRTLDVVDVRTLEVFKRIPLSGLPNNLDVAKDNSKVYVAIREAPGAVDVIDAASLTRIKTIATKGPIHNVYLVPDGNFAIAGSIEEKTINVIDVARDDLSWTLTLDAGIRPMAFMKSGDGSTSKMLVQLSDLHGFVLIDYGTREIEKRIEFPALPDHHKEMESLQGSPAHGIALSPDQKTVWSTSKYYGVVYAYGAPQPCRGWPEKPAPKGSRCDWEMLAAIDVGGHPDWLAMTPDGKKLYVALAGDDETAVIDTETMKVIKKIRVGNVPKRVVAGVVATR
ncbi:MAG: hypothetical protein R2748_15500 [Bryobacterales bacterium]